MRRPVILSLILLTVLVSCTSYEQYRYITEEQEMPSQVYPESFEKTWLATVQTMKKFDISLQNQESGVLKTRWVDNTQAVNFVDSFDKKNRVKSAKYKITINVEKGLKASREISKVTVYRRQLVEQDFLQGWKERPSDGIMEKAILYRIKRKLIIDRQLLKAQKEREKELIENF